MKVSKIFGVVLSLHLGVIAVLVVQPGCSTRQPPTKTYQQQETLGSQAQSDLDLIPAVEEVDAGTTIDASFNADIGVGASDLNDRVEPTRPTNNLDNAGMASMDDFNTTVDIAGPSYESYTIQKGDSLWAISRRKNVSLNDIYTANALSEKSVLSIGQEIRIPVEGSTAVIQTQVADMYQPSAFNATTTNYKVVAGDTLTRIATKFDTTVGAIKAANGMASDLIRLNSTLVIPVSAGMNVAEGDNVTAELQAEAVTEAVVDEESTMPTSVEEEVTESTPEPVTLNVVSADATIEEEVTIQESDPNQKADELFEAAVEIPVVSSPTE